MNRRLDGINPLAYMGVKPSTPTQMVVNRDRRPTSNDLQNFQLGTWWLIPTRGSTPSNEVWILINKTATAATWIELDSGGGSVVPGAQYTLLTADGSGGYGSNVGPGTAGQVLLSGGAGANPSFVTPTAGAGLTVTTNASTLEFALNGPFNVDDGGTGLTSVTIHNLLIGNNTAALTLLPPSATSGQPLVSQGAGADPAYGTAVVAGGGTGKTSFTSYAVLCGGTTSAGALQNVSGVGTSGQVLTSNGAGSLPSWQNSAGVVVVSVQVITSSGTYTPTVGTRYCTVEIVGGGGGAGGAVGFPSSGASANAASGGGGSGGYCKSFFDVATATGESITIGSGGAGGTSSNTGTAGGNTTFGSGGILMTAGGGAGGKGISHVGNTGNLSVAGGAGGSATGGNIINVTGEPGDVAIRGAWISSTDTYAFKGANGGSSPFGRGGQGSQWASISSVSSNTSFDATGYGSGGGSGLAITGSGTISTPGGAGTDGICIITEFA